MKPPTVDEKGGTFSSIVSCDWSEKEDTDNRLGKANLMNTSSPSQ